MSEYRFYDSDPTGVAEYDIKGDEYFKLLEACFEFCTSVSFVFCRKSGFPLKWDERMEIYRIPVTNENRIAYGHYGFGGECESAANIWYEIRHYRLCTESQELIRGMTDSLFSWVSSSEHCMPDDPVFYRRDGTVFFFSLIHEGECSLFPRPDEDVSRIVAKNLWKMEGGC